MLRAPALLTTAVLALGVAPVASASADVHPEWGSTSAEDGVLKRGCHDYAYSYALTPPEGDWSLETFITAPDGKQVASGNFVVNYDALSATTTFKLCRRATRAGRYKIRALLSVQDSSASEYVEGELPVTTFRLSPPRRHPH